MKPSLFLSLLALSLSGCGHEVAFTGTEPVVPSGPIPAPAPVPAPMPPQPAVGAGTMAPAPAPLPPAPPAVTCTDPIAAPAGAPTGLQALVDGRQGQWVLKEQVSYIALSASGGRVANSALRALYGSTAQGWGVTQFEPICSDLTIMPSGKLVLSETLPMGWDSRSGLKSLEFMKVNEIRYGATLSRQTARGASAVSHPCASVECWIQENNPRIELYRISDQEVIAISTSDSTSQQGDPILLHSSARFVWSATTDTSQDTSQRGSVSQQSTPRDVSQK